MLGTADLAALLNVPRQAVYELNHRGNGPPRYRIGKQLRYKQSEVLAWIESRRVTAQPSP